MNRQRWLLLAVVVLLSAVIVWRLRSDEGAVQLGQRVIDSARGRWWALPVYIALGVARPVFLLPATLITVAAGIMFGPWLGVLAAAVAANGSAMVVYWFGSALRVGRGVSAEPAARWRQRLKSRTFESTLTARLLFVPYDAVNLAAGALRVAPLPFLAATAIGSLPGTAAFVIAGSSIRRLDQGWKGLSIGGIIASVGVIVASLVVARLLRRSARSTSTERE